MEYQSTKGEEAVGPKALVTMGAIRNGNILTNTELSPYTAVWPNNFLYNFYFILIAKVIISMGNCQFLVLNCD